MIDLCIDARMAYFSGIGTCIRELVPLINQPPFRVLLLVDQVGRDWCSGIDQIPFSAPIYSLKEQVYFPSKIPKTDLFWSPHYNVPLLPIRAKKRIVTIHDVCHLAFGNRLQKIYATLLMKMALRSSSIVTDSFFSKKEIAHYLGEPKNLKEVIPMAVNKDQFRRITDPKRLQQISQKYDLSPHFILYVGNRKPHKNLAGLLRGFSSVPLPELELIIVGKGEEKISGARVKVLEGVPNEDLTVLYSLATAFVFPSFYEGFGLPPLEAMSCGCPTIVSQAASLPEVCAEASLYVDPAQPKQIGEAIEKIATDLSYRQQLIQKGYERIQQFEWSQTAASYRNLFERVYRE